MDILSLCIVIEQYMKGKDVLFCSLTGSGKSLGFEMGPSLFQYLEKSDSVHAL